ncbi:hypothetical protein I4U23_010485 [Adineta vaga]|nr:hypothetical protein I4U23_010485 [Adineta vaga]
MVIANGLSIIWLDTHIGVIGDYLGFKERFKSNLQAIANMPPNGINELIYYFENNVAPIHFVSTSENALALIQYHTDKKIVFISSGALGKEIIPTIVSDYPRVQSYYIFCLNMAIMAEWALESDYDSVMQMFDHETDLLLALVRDISVDIIKLGRSYMQVNDGENARKCFVTAETLEMQANAINICRAPLMTRLQLLQGENGLIAQARQLQQ